MPWVHDVILDLFGNTKGQSFSYAILLFNNQCIFIGHIRLSVSTVNRTYELSGITHVTPFRKYRNIRLGPVITDRESVPTTSCSPVSPSLRFVVTESGRMKSVRTEGRHVRLFREFVGTACCTYGSRIWPLIVLDSTTGKCLPWFRWTVCFLYNSFKSVYMRNIIKVW